jgi:hypothetical protein
MSARFIVLGFGLAFGLGFVGRLVMWALSAQSVGCETQCTGSARWSFPFCTFYLFFFTFTDCGASGGARGRIEFCGWPQCNHTRNSRTRSQSTSPLRNSTRDFRRDRGKQAIWE